MVRKDFLLCKTRNSLDEFLCPMLAEVDKPRQRFLRQSVKGVLLSGSLVVTEIRRWIHDQCSDPFYQVKRLLNHLISPKAHLKEALSGYRRAMSKHIEYLTPLIIDLTDLAKPRAKRMKYLAMVHDGSEHKLVKGYWCIEVYAHLKKKRILPLALESYSIEDPNIGSENLQIQRVIQAIDSDLNGKGVWVGDRGFDRLSLYQTWFSLKSHFVVRQRGDRMVITPEGVRVILRDYVERLRQQQMYLQRATDVTYGQVWLPDSHQPLFFVASWRAGHDDPLILLTTLTVLNREQAFEVLYYYQKRWICEEAGEFLKSRVGLERFRVRRYEAIGNLMVLALLAMGFLTWILLRSRDLTKRLLKYTSRFRKDAKFRYYRLLDGLQEFARQNPNLLKELIT